MRGKMVVTEKMANGRARAEDAPEGGRGAEQDRPNGSRERRPPASAGRYAMAALLSGVTAAAFVTRTARRLQPH